MRVCLPAQRVLARPTQLRAAITQHYIRLRVLPYDQEGTTMAHSHRTHHTSFLPVQRLSLDGPLKGPAHVQAREKVIIYYTFES